jgi:integrase/recombinase XerD
MTTLDSDTHILAFTADSVAPDEAELAAVAFLARYSGRTLDAYRHDLRNLFQWAGDHGLAVLEASRAHFELYRSSMQERGLAASTIDRCLSTACGYYRFAYIDGRISSNPAQYVRRPTVHPSERRGLDRGELGRFLFAAERFDQAHAALAVLLGLNGPRVSEACETNIDATTVSDSTGAPPTAGSDRSESGQDSVWCTRIWSERRSSWPPSTQASRCEKFRRRS